MMSINKKNKKVLSGGSFGLISMFLVILETFYYLVRWRREAKNKGEPIVNDVDF